MVVSSRKTRSAFTRITIDFRCGDRSRSSRASSRGSVNTRAERGRRPVTQQLDKES